MATCSIGIVIVYIYLYVPYLGRETRVLSLGLRPGVLFALLGRDTHDELASVFCGPSTKRCALSEKADSSPTDGRLLVLSKAAAALRNRSLPKRQTHQDAA